MESREEHYHPATALSGPARRLIISPPLLFRQHHPVVTTIRQPMWHAFKQQVIGRYGRHNGTVGWLRAMRMDLPQRKQRCQFPLHLQRCLLAPQPYRVLPTGLIRRKRRLLRTKFPPIFQVFLLLRDGHVLP